MIEIESSALLTYLASANHRFPEPPGDLYALHGLTVKYSHVYSGFSTRLDDQRISAPTNLARIVDLERDGTLRLSAWWKHLDAELKAHVQKQMDEIVRQLNAAANLRR